jgi:hypothetical protein
VEVAAYDADTALVAEPVMLPVILPVTVKLPVIVMFPT